MLAKHDIKVIGLLPTKGASCLEPNKEDFFKGKGKVVPALLTEHPAIKAYWGSGGIASRILDLGTRWR
jgi:hypothetical protein